jgi:RNA polymerase sigma-70 factor (ECF subfamily)
MLSSEADLDLLKRYSTGGDPDAFGELVRRYTSMVYHTCLRVLHDRALAEDASQDTFYRLMSSPGTVNRSVGAWLHRTATRRSLDVLRSDTARARREAAYSKDYYHGKANPPGWNVLSPKIDEALAQLSEPTRSLLVEHFLAGKSQRQLAQETNTSTATVCRRIKQGLAELQKHMKTTGMIVTGAALVSMLSSQTTLAAPPQVCAELGKMAMISGDPSAFGSPGVGAVTKGGLLMKAGTIAFGLLVVAVLFYWLAQIGNGPASVVPAPGQEGTRASVLNQTAQPQAETRSSKYPDTSIVYLIPQQDYDFDSRTVVSFQPPTDNPDVKINVGFADGHVVSMRVDEVEPILVKQTGKTIHELMQLIPPTPMPN